MELDTKYEKKLPPDHPFSRMPPKTATKTKTTAPSGQPFPDFVRPHPDECIAATKLLGQLHGFPERAQLQAGAGTILEAIDGSKMSVLDSLIRTILSQVGTARTVVADLICTYCHMSYVMCVYVQYMIIDHILYIYIIPKSTGYHT